MNNYHGIEDLERAARKRLPRMVDEYIAGGASTELTVAENRRAFDRISLVPRVLVDLSHRSTVTRVLGQPIALPVIAGPAGLAPLVNRGGEVAVARAAAAAGSVFCVSNASGLALEQIADGAPNARLWFQLFSCTNREIARQFVARARAARCEALILGVDLPIGGLRYRDERNGMKFPPRPKLRDLLDFLVHPRWLSQIAFSRNIVLGNYEKIMASMGGATDSYSFLTQQVLKPACSWEDLSWLRRAWDGPIVVKGIMTAADAREAADRGADAIVVSNHGGRQLDWQPATIEVLPEVVEAVHGKTEIYLDGGVRHGSDVVKALALGARACLVARPWYWSLAAGGEAGVAAMFEIFRHEVDNVIGLIGCPDVLNLGPHHVRVHALLQPPGRERRWIGAAEPQGGAL